MQRFYTRVLPFMVLAAVSASCTLSSSKTIKSGSLAGSRKNSCSEVKFERDWSRFPATLSLQIPNITMYAVGDIHGHFEDFYEMLLRANVISGPKIATVDGFKWSAQNAILIQVGDLINKGNRTLDTLRFAMALEKQAAAAGGKAIFLMGNHEASLLADPFNSKTKELRKELDDTQGAELCKDLFVPKTTDDLATWIRNRPAAMTLNGVYFSHSGWDSEENSLQEIAEKFSDKPYGKFSCGEKKLAGFLNVEAWWGKKGKGFAASLKRLNVSQIMFGHDPNAFKARGQIAGYFGSIAPRAGLIKLDAGLGNDDTRGGLLRCTKWWPDGGCSAPERLMNPDEPNDSASFIPLQIDPDAPPAQERDDSEHDGSC